MPGTMLIFNTERRTNITLPNPAAPAAPLPSAETTGYVKGTLTS